MRLPAILMTILYVGSLGVGGYFYMKNNASSASAIQELATTKGALASLQSNLDAEQVKSKELESKIADASLNAQFLKLALCPVLEAANTQAICVKDNTEWFSQTMLSGTMITDPAVKTKMDELLVSIGAKTKPTAKQLYEMLKPIEVASLETLGENLK